jgi:hypothetical protein
MGTSRGFLTRTFNGPYRDDIIFTSSFDMIKSRLLLSAYQYFKVIISKASGTAQYAFRKLYFRRLTRYGKGARCEYNLEVNTERDSEYLEVCTFGHVIMSRAFYPRHRVTVEWDGVSDAKANELALKIMGDP